MLIAAFIAAKSAKSGVVESFLSAGAVGVLAYHPAVIAPLVPAAAPALYVYSVPLIFTVLSASSETSLAVSQASTSPSVEPIL